jgi:hypothetical protein
MDTARWLLEQCRRLPHVRVSVRFAFNYPHLLA